MVVKPSTSEMTYVDVNNMEKIIAAERKSHNLAAKMETWRAVMSRKQGAAGPSLSGGSYWSNVVSCDLVKLTFPLHSRNV